ncbi:hypothetical protein Pmani_015377 [Petrolisthes manimaculis]|uniref:Uncharacterized protein n=2 Tax=Petrolisthes manimaculis TaxID=1843537 RepID=A0AAE1PR10_9EUCA|nr:hypothetical protein Pmani_015377 [Petrolisthes manimaculis]
MVTICRGPGRSTDIATEDKLISYQKRNSTVAPKRLLTSPYVLPPTLLMTLSRSYTCTSTFIRLRAISIPVERSLDSNEDLQEQLSDLHLRCLGLGVGEPLRRMSWCVMVVLVSDDLAFLSNFAKLSLNGRLLVWSTKLLVVTRLPREDLVLILSSHWTFSMTNAMMLNVDQRSDSLR